MFIEPDEHLIIMDINEREEGYSLSISDMRKLKDAGVKTLYFMGALRWNMMQPRADMPMNWARTDAFVERARTAKLKMLIPFLFSLPDWKPDDYYFSRATNGQLYDVPNYDNPEVARELDEFMIEAIDRYGADDCQVIYSIPGNGEFALNGNGRMDYPMEVFTDWVVARQRILVRQYDEIWTAFHPYYNPVYWRALYGALFSAYPLSKHYGIIFTYVQHKMPHIKELLDFTRHTGMVYYGGTEYVQGMRENVPILKADKARMLTAPKHPYQKHQEVNAWMQDEIRWAIGQYNEI